MKDIRILIVEGNQLSVKKLNQQLEELGYSVCGIASTGTEARQLIEDTLHRHVQGEEPGGKQGPLVQGPLEQGPLISVRLEEPFEEHPKALKATNRRLRHEIEGLRQAIKALKESEQHFREMLKNVQLITVMLDTSARITFCNDYLLRLTNWRREEVLYQDWFDKFVPNSQEARGRYKDSMQRGTIDPHYVSTIRTRAGNELVISWSNTILRDAEGNVLGINSIGQDITDAQRSEEALRESESRYRQVVELSPMLIAIQRPEKITYINPAGVGMLGEKDAEQLIGRSLLEYIPSEERQALYEHFFKLARTGKELPLTEQTIIRRDGSHLEVEVSATVAQKENETTVQVIAWDITERKSLQEALKRQAALAEIELAINQPRELQTTLDRVTELTTQLLPASVGASVALWDENSHDFWIGSSTVPQPMRALVDRHIRRPDGASRWIIENKKPVITPNIAIDPFSPNMTLTRHHFRAYVGMPLIFEEEVLGVLFVLDNVIRNYTRQDLDFLAGLANRAALAIAKVQLYDSLLQARSAAEDTARTKDQFLANMSHELRTPLTAVVSFSELLEETELDEHQRDLVHTISTSTDRLLSLINNILDFSRLEAEKLPLDAQPFDLRNCVEDVLDLVKLETRRKGLDLAYHIADGVPNYLLGDANRLSQVLTNLVDNAVKFSEEGEITLSVRVRPPTAQLLESKATATKQIELLFAIHDTGIGIPPDKINTLFSPFQQIDASTTRKYGGTGLGLAISKQIVNLMGGDIWAVSDGTPGEGTAFYFTIRAQTVDTPLPLYLQRSQPLLVGKQVALVSGPENHRHVISDLLTYWGMQVVAFETCQQATSWLKAGNSIDLVVMVFNQPQEAHRLLVKEIYANRDPESTPLMVITSTENKPETDWPVDISAWLDTPIKPLRLHDSLTQIYLHAIEPEPIPEPGTPQTVKHAFRILIAEDDPTNRKALTMLLDHFGYPYESVVNGIEAIAALEHKPFDIVLMDLQMPEMDGLSATRYIRASMPAERQPYIIALTADARKQARDEMIAVGVNEYLTKPVRSEALVQAVERAYGHPGGSRHPAPLPASAPAKFQARDSVLDESVLADFIDLMGEKAPDALTDLVGSFLENAPLLIQKLRNAAETKNWQQVKWAAHTLKGNCELLGGASLAQMCKQLENRVDLGVVGGVMERIEYIEVEFEAVKDALLKKSARL